MSKQKKDSSHVYILAHASEPRLKIGKANDVYRRALFLGIEEFDFSSSMALRVKSERDALSVESALHKLFRNWRIQPSEINPREGRTEWFESSCKEVLFDYVMRNASLLCDEVIKDPTSLLPPFAAIRDQCLEEARSLTASCAKAFVERINAVQESALFRTRLDPSEGSGTTLVLFHRESEAIKVRNLLESVLDLRIWMKYLGGSSVATKVASIRSGSGLLVSEIRTDLDVENPPFLLSNSPVELLHKQTGEAPMEACAGLLKSVPTLDRLLEEELIPLEIVQTLDNIASGILDGKIRPQSLKVAAAWLHRDHSFPDRFMIRHR